MFRIAAGVTAVVFLVLFVILLVAGRAYVTTYGVAPSDGADFLARRAAPLFAGLAVMLWLLRGLPVGTARDGVCYGLATVWFGIAATGVYEFTMGQAEATILIAATAEVIGGAVFVLVRRR
ncbi:hypothetical protein [Yoonia vestfoldensis]|uniref:hypothetical protein n=1 Tax=Yoonia vestfoldensis TaxID=245188 RepID=UPI00036C602E|nr:hypothetical protein [Yoonia vestfoldensis]